MTITEPAQTQQGSGGDTPHVTVLADRCAGCQECVIRCPAGALSIDPGRWVAVADDDLCVGCRQCERTCPFSAIEVTGPLVVALRAALPAHHPGDLAGDVTETRQGFSSWESALAEAQRCLSCPDPTCVRGCPAHNDIPGFIAAIRAGDLAGAHTVLRRTTVLPDVCSRVCDQAAQCEGACTWSLAGGEPVAIGALERFVADNSPVPPVAAPSASLDLSVGIVGSGPAGIGAAWELAQAGASVTVYEADTSPGGLLRWGIPDFTLPAEIAHRPWRQLTAAGVELRCGRAVAPGEMETLLAEHDAVVLAHGAGLPMRMAVPGADLAGVEDATTFLTRAQAALAAGHGLPKPRADGQLRLLVVGAGNTAMDVARSARRLGARVTCVDWMDRRFAPVRPDELAEAEAEGVEVRFSTTLERLDGDGGQVRLAWLAPTRQRDAGTRPRVLSGARSSVPVDLVVMAMGYRTDPAFAEILPGSPVPRRAQGLPDRRWQASGVLARPASPFAHRHRVGELSLGREAGLASSSFAFRDRVWAAGDALVGPSTVVEAMAQGRRAAQAVLAARPRRQGLSPAIDKPRRVLVCYESRSGRTARTATAVADALRGQRTEVMVRPLAEVGATELAWADLIVAGTWVEGLVVARVGPARGTRDWLGRLPRLGGKQVGLFCTYGISPKATLEVMARAFTARGAVVVAATAFARAATAAQAAAFAGAVAAGARVPETAAG